MPTIETGTKGRLARSIVAFDGTQLRAGRTVYVVASAHDADSSRWRADAPRQVRSRSGLASYEVTTADGRHTAEVLAVDLRPA